MDLSWETQRLVLRTPLRISRGATRCKDVALVHLEHDGLVGHGEAPATAYYQQPLEVIVAALGKLGRELSAEQDPFAALVWLDAQVSRPPNLPVVHAALDAALHDWIGKRIGMPVHRFLGVPGGPFETAYTISIGAPEEAAQSADAAFAAGYRTLKLKVGLPSLDADRELVRAVRDAAPAARLLLDANGGWPTQQAAERLAALAPFEPILVEQPVAPGQLAALRELRGRTSVRIWADEDAQSAADIPGLWGAVDGVNVKLTKCGGVRQALAMIQTARAVGMGVMLGCVVCSSLGMAPSFHLAGLADYLDLDGHLLLEQDPWTGLGTATRLEPGTEAGLGVRPSPHL